MQLDKQQQGFALIEMLFSIAIISLGFGVCFQLTQDIFKQDKLLKSQTELRSEIIEYSSWLLEMPNETSPSYENFSMNCRELALERALICQIQTQLALPSSLQEFKLLQ